MIYPTATISDRTELIMDETATIEDFTLITVPVLVLGPHARIHAGTKIIGREQCAIYEHANVGYDCLIMTSTDRLAKCMDDDSPEKKRSVFDSPISIGKYAFIGSNTTVFPGCNIHDYAVVGDNSRVDSMTHIDQGEVWSTKRGTFVRWANRTH